VALRFDPSTTVFLIPNNDNSPGSAIDPIWIKIIDPTLAFATFNLHNTSPVPYDLHAVSKGLFIDAEIRDSTEYIVFDTLEVIDETVLPGCFTVVAGGISKLDSRLIVPSAAMHTKDFAFTLDIFNSGNIDAPLPLIRIRGLDGVPLSTRQNVPDNGTYEMQLMVLSTEGNRDIFAPRQRNLIQFYTNAVHTPQTVLTMKDLTSSEIGQPDWDALEEKYRDNSNESDWMQTWSNFRAMVGNTWQEYFDALRQVVAQRLKPPSTQYYFVDELVRDLLDKARIGSPNQFLNLTDPPLPENMNFDREIVTKNLSIAKAYSEYNTDERELKEYEDGFLKYMKKEYEGPEYVRTVWDRFLYEDTNDRTYKHTDLPGFFDDLFTYVSFIEWLEISLDGIYNGLIARIKYDGGLSCDKPTYFDITDDCQWR